MKLLHLMASGQIGGIEILNKAYAGVSQLNHHYVFVWSGGCVADEMLKEGHQVTVLNASKRDFCGPWKRLMLMCRKEQFDGIVVPYTAPALYLYAMKLKRKYPHLKIFAYFHESAKDTYKPDGTIKQRMKTRIIGQFVNMADIRIAVSDSVKRSLMECYGVEEEKVVRIYNGVDLKLFKQKKHEEHAGAELIYCGRLIREKGVQNTIKALALLPKEDRYRLRIVGDGNYRKELENLVKQYNLESKVFFLGEHKEVPALLSQSDIFIHLPEGEEGFGITVIEAMASGLVCVCGRRGALVELIVDNKSGYLSDTNPQEAAALLHQVMQENKYLKWNQIGDGARKRAQDFSMESYTRQLDQLFIGSMDG